MTVNLFSLISGSNSCCYFYFYCIIKKTQPTTKTTKRAFLPKTPGLWDTFQVFRLWKFFSDVQAKKYFSVLGLCFTSKFSEGILKIIKACNLTKKKNYCRKFSNWFRRKDSKKCCVSKNCLYLHKQYLADLKNSSAVSSTCSVSHPRHLGWLLKKQ